MFLFIATNDNDIAFRKLHGNNPFHLGRAVPSKLASSRLLLVIRRPTQSTPHAKPMFKKAMNSVSAFVGPRGNTSSRLLTADCQRIVQADQATPSPATMSVAQILPALPMFSAKRAAESARKPTAPSPATTYHLLTSALVKLRCHLIS